MAIYLEMYQTDSRRKYSDLSNNEARQEIESKNLYITKKVNTIYTEGKEIILDNAKLDNIGFIFQGINELAKFHGLESLVRPLVNKPFN